MSESPFIDMVVDRDAQRRWEEGVARRRAVILSLVAFLLTGAACLIKKLVIAPYVDEHLDFRERSVLGMGLVCFCGPPLLAGAVLNLAAVILYCRGRRDAGWKVVAVLAFLWAVSVGEGAWVILWPPLPVQAGINPYGASANGEDSAMAIRRLPKPNEVKRMTACLFHPDFSDLNLPRAGDVQQSGAGNTPKEWPIKREQPEGFAVPPRHIPGILKLLERARMVDFHREGYRAWGIMGYLTIECRDHAVIVIQLYRTDSPDPNEAEFRISRRGPNGEKFSERFIGGNEPQIIKTIQDAYADFKAGQ